MHPAVYIVLYLGIPLVVRINIKIVACNDHQTRQYELQQQTHPPTRRQDRLQYTAMQVAHSVMRQLVQNHPSKSSKSELIMFNSLDGIKACSKGALSVM